MSPHVHIHIHIHSHRIPPPVVHVLRVVVIHEHVVAIVVHSCVAIIIVVEVGVVIRPRRMGMETATTRVPVVHGLLEIVGWCGGLRSRPTELLALR